MATPEDSPIDSSRTSTTLPTIPEAAYRCRTTPEPPVNRLIGSQLAAALHRTFTSDATLVDRPSTSNSDFDDGINDLTHEPTRNYYDDLERRPSRLEIEEGRWWPSAKAWQTYFMQEVAKDHYLEAQLMWMTAATGCLDTMTYTTYSVFTTKMTGNTMFLALYALQHPSMNKHVEKNVAVSIGTFILGAIFFGHLGHCVRQRRRLWVLMTNFFQMMLVLAATAIRFWASREPVGPGAQGILALLSLAFSGQIALALCVQMPELNTTMITGAIIQICTDRNFFKIHNIARNRRVLFCISLLCGCFVGSSALVYKSPTCALLLVACFKGVGTFSFFFNHGIVDVVKSDLEAPGKVEGTATPINKILWGD
ncbi:hypothetical protein K431DRAFT_302070 [Polychaeton citri CBS 116435]|uniref:DUF1275 domain protein n=1 Tax=Polychaeton citri CBS 116435 TaxID=1314669 RepID=A0A9P4QCE9_9PEZI|nr:hypothetical protein K431DRAFT_302070 [Polychaeton citri CBS 116435]